MICRRVVLSFCLASVCASGARAQVEPPIAVALRHAPADALHAQLESYLPVLTRAYAGRKFQPIWTDAAGLNAAGRSVVGAFRLAEEDGLKPADYLVPSVESPASDPSRLAEADVLLSAAALRFARDLGWGLTSPSEVDRDNDYAPRRFDADAVFARIVAAGDPGRELQALAPASPAYALLKKGLAQLRGVQRAGGWKTVSPGPTLRTGDRGPRVEELRARLVERGDLTQGAGDTFDAALADGLKRFQRRHGLEEDGVYGRDVVGEFNVPLATRIEQLQLGMERLRWLPGVFTGRRIAVNLADFKAYVLDGDTVTHEMRTVVGKQYHETPMFTASMTYIVINPYWNVPPSIAKAEILPKAQRDPAYLARNHMEVVGGAVRQLPGPWNSLGFFKFMFPNAHNIYLHDTPARNLFEQTDRAYSHGCVRVDRPADLAAVLLKDQGWTPERIAATVKSGDRTVVTLDTPIPVEITYATAFLDTDGLLHYRRDVYGRDRKLIEALAHRSHGSWER